MRLVGGASAANQPTGLINVPWVRQNVAIDPVNFHSDDPRSALHYGVPPIAEGLSTHA